MSFENNTTFTENETKIWNITLSAHSETREFQIIDLFNTGLEVLNITPNKIPQLSNINKILKKNTGFRVVYVNGLEDGTAYYQNGIKICHKHKPIK